MKAQSSSSIFIVIITIVSISVFTSIVLYRKEISSFSNTTITTMYTTISKTTTSTLLTTTTITSTTSSTTTSSTSSTSTTTSTTTSSTSSTSTTTSTTTTLPEGCYEEGEYFNLLEDPNAICCHDLTQIKYSFLIDDQCISPACPCFVCTKCGNGSCGIGENQCNCPEDCS